jgi:hypothetical protein
MGERVDLPVKRRHDVRVAMTEAGHGRPARGVEIAATFGVDDLDSGGRDGDGHDGVCGAVQNMPHGTIQARLSGREA